MAKPAVANFQIAPRPTFRGYNEFNFTNLYLYHTSAGPKPNQAAIVTRDSATGLGLTAVNNWQICDGLGPDAKVVARAQGLHMYAGNWHCNFTMAFENERFKASTLVVSGVAVEDGEWAIVGGTGEFKMATGVIYKKILQQNSDGNIIELTIHGFCPVLALKPYKAGPWGGKKSGVPFDVIETPVRLESITVRHGDIVDRIEFSYVDEAGEKHSAEHGGFGGQSTTIKLDPSEYVVQVAGTTVLYEGSEEFIGTIKIVTNKQSYGPYGRPSLPINTISSFTAAEDGYSIVGFYGRCASHVNGIGCYMRPI